MSAQYGIVAAACEFKMCREGNSIKWWRLKDAPLKDQLNANYMSELTPREDE